MFHRGDAEGAEPMCEFSPTYYPYRLSASPAKKWRLPEDETPLPLKGLILLILTASFPNLSQQILPNGPATTFAEATAVKKKRRLPEDEASGEQFHAEGAESMLK